IVRRDAVVPEVDAELGVGENRVPEDGVAGAGISNIVSNCDPVAAVEGDHVAGTGGRAADRVVRGPRVDVNTVKGVAQGIGPPAHIGTDLVARADVLVRPLAADDDAIVVISRDHVAGAGSRAADRVAGGPCVDIDAAIRIAEREGPSGVGANHVPLNDVVGGAVDPDTAVPVRRDDVARPGRRAPDRIAGGSRSEVHPLKSVTEWLGTRDVGTDEVALDEIAGRAYPINGETTLTISGDDVACTGGRAADRVVHGP